MTIMVTPACECELLLKWAATGKSSVLLSKISERCPFILQWRGCPVPPTYCWPHLLHVIRHITLEDLHKAVIITLNRSPVVWLEKASVANSMGQVLHLAAPHSWLPASSRDTVVKDAHTRRSFRFFRWRKAMKGGAGYALPNRSETWRIHVDMLFGS